MVEVEQVDRDAAARIERANGFVQLDGLLSGECDNMLLVQAFARHRLSSTAALRDRIEADDWQTLETAPVACHVLATRFDEAVGEWVVAVVLSPPSQPFTHWKMLPAPPRTLLSRSEGNG